MCVCMHVRAVLCDGTCEHICAYALCRWECFVFECVASDVCKCTGLRACVYWYWCPSGISSILACVDARPCTRITPPYMSTLHPCAHVGMLVCLCAVSQVVVQGVQLLVGPLNMDDLTPEVLESRLITLYHTIPRTARTPRTHELGPFPHLGPRSSTSHHTTELPEAAARGQGAGPGPHGRRAHGCTGAPTRTRGRGPIIAIRGWGTIGERRGEGQGPVLDGEPHR